MPRPTQPLPSEDTDDDGPASIEKAVQALETAIATAKAITIKPAWGALVTEYTRCSQAREPFAIWA